MAASEPVWPEHVRRDSGAGTENDPGIASFSPVLINASCKTAAPCHLGNRTNMMCEQRTRPVAGGAESMAAEHFDVLIVGAGLSGIGAGYHLQKECPGKSYAILEGRDCIGGTWDLFRYPGIRSDSDMFTLGYSFKPWTEPKAIADGPLILNYVRQTATDNGIDKKIRFNHRVVKASWSSTDATWTVEAERGPSKELVSFTCNFLFMCSGYYKYENGYLPEFKGYDTFKGQIVHPQKWPEQSRLCRQAGRCDRLGRHRGDPGAGDGEDRSACDHAAAIADLRGVAPGAGRGRQQTARTAWAGIGVSRDPLAQCAARHVFLPHVPARTGEGEEPDLSGVRAALGPDYDVSTHFTPRYNPWQQRLCLIPDGDLFKSIREGRASVVTDTIDTFTEKGIQLVDGTELEADIIVTATGLVLQVLGGMQVAVDGKTVDFAHTLNYKGMMYSNVPNLASAFGYTNASWTLKCDLTCEYVSRLLNYMDKQRLRLLHAAQHRSVRDGRAVD